MASYFTTKGKDITTAALHAYASRFKYIAWGTGSGQTGTSNALAVAAAEARTDGTSSQQTTTTTNDTYQVAGTITATGARAITEVGLFDASTSGNMGLYGDFTVINLATNDSITFTAKVVYS